MSLGISHCRSAKWRQSGSHHMWGEEDHEDRLKHGVAALRQHKIERMANEALDQGALLTGEDLALRIFNCGLRTISRDLKALSEKGVVVPLRSQQKDAGRAPTHRVQVVEMYLKRHTFTQIRQRMRHWKERLLTKLWHVGGVFTTDKYHDLPPETADRLEVHHRTIR